MNINPRIPIMIPNAKFVILINPPNKKQELSRYFFQKNRLNPKSILSIALLGKKSKYICKVKRNILCQVLENLGFKGFRGRLLFKPVILTVKQLMICNC